MDLPSLKLVGVIGARIKCEELILTCLRDPLTPVTGYL